MRKGFPKPFFQKSTRLATIPLAEASPFPHPDVRLSDDRQGRTVDSLDGEFLVDHQSTRRGGSSIIHPALQRMRVLKGRVAQGVVAALIAKWTRSLGDDAVILIAIRMRRGFDVVSHSPDFRTAGFIRSKVRTIITIRAGSRGVIALVLRSVVPEIERD